MSKQTQSAPIQFDFANPGVSRTAQVPRRDAPIARPPAQLPMQKTSVRPASGATFNFGAAVKGASSSTPNTRASLIQPGTDTLTGELLNVTMYRDNWGRGSLKLNNGKTITVVGSALAGLTPEVRYKFTGTIKVHETYGEQIDAHSAEIDVHSIKAVIEHIVNNYNGVGLVGATKMVHAHEGRGTLEQLKHSLIFEPASVDFSEFTNRQVSLKESDDKGERLVFNALSIRFGGIGISQNVLLDLAFNIVRLTDSDTPDDIVRKALSKFEENPYIFIGMVDRYSFNVADALAKTIDIGPNDERRINALVGYALKRSCSSSGHVWVDHKTLLDSITSVDAKVQAQWAIQQALSSSQNIVHEIIDDDGNKRYYPSDLMKHEEILVESITNRLDRDAIPLLEVKNDEQLQSIIDRAVKDVGQSKGIKDFELDPSQMEALKGILTSRVNIHTLTGGPGCGKTALIEVLLEIVGDDQKPLFCAPVGKAAKVLSSRVKKWGQASTIHSALEYNGVGFEIDSRNPHDVTMVVSDESSMLCSMVGAGLFEGVVPNSHMILLGDPGQLASVGPGQVLKSILEIDGINHHKLTTVHRNEGDILRLVNQVGSGQVDVDSFVNSKDVTLSGSIPTACEEEVERLANDMKELAGDVGGYHRGLDSIGVICPMRKGSVDRPGWNVTWLNARLREYLNPDYTGDKRVKGTSLRVGDRVIITKNMMTEFHSSLNNGDQNKTLVVNGDTGTIIGSDVSSNRDLRDLIIALDDGRRVRISHKVIDKVSLAYAITVHASQGSEYAHVFAFMPDGHPSFIHQAMMYTSFSRAKSSLRVFADNSVLCEVAKRPAPNRNCSLVESVKRQQQANKNIHEHADQYRVVA